MSDYNKVNEKITDAPIPGWFTRDQIATYLGVTPYRVNHYVRYMGLPRTRINGQCYLVSKKDLHQWLKDNPNIKEAARERRARKKYGR